LELRLSDIQRNESSYVDPNGFVFTYEDNIYRAIHPGVESFYRTLHDNGALERLSSKTCLVESRITDISLPEAECRLVFQHEKIEPLTYCVEWCPSMLKQAATATLELALALEESGCILQDAYPWNILFSGSRPVHVDLTSIVPAQGASMLWPAYQQFVNFFIHPLTLASMGKGETARWLLHDYINGIPLREVNAHQTIGNVLKHPLRTAASWLLEVAEKAGQKNRSLRLKLQNQKSLQDKVADKGALRRKMLSGLLARVKKINLPPVRDSWVGYYEKIEGVEENRKEEIIASLLDRLAPKTVLDVGCNVGRYSMIAARSGARVISLDGSEYCIEALFQQAQAENLAITPVVGDILNPTPAFGFLASQFPSMIERFRSEVVLCLAVMHHLHINGRQSFDRIARLMDALSQKAVIFEYVDRTDDNIHLLDHGRNIEYDLERVSGELSRYFTVTPFASDRETRKILLCEKR